ncbi:hypothetical protein [Prosthecobacter sp.]|uniref:hypothetical protein n=1 Tax=Prosthecobacter sp. TaxID=1965333 RepID=UPI0037842A6B
MKKDIEATLRAQSWRDPPPEFLESVLHTALEESRQRSGALREPGDGRKLQRAGALTRSARPSGNLRLSIFATLRFQDAVAHKKTPRVLALFTFIPRPLRLPLAACWMLAFFFRATTPEAIPQSTLDSYAKLPPLTPAQLLANLKQIEKLADELLHPQHHGAIPPL